MFATKIRASWSSRFWFGARGRGAEEEDADGELVCRLESASEDDAEVEEVGEGVKPFGRVGT